MGLPDSKFSFLAMMLHQFPIMSVSPIMFFLTQERIIDVLYCKHLQMAGRVPALTSPVAYADAAAHWDGEEEVVVRSVQCKCTS